MKPEHKSYEDALNVEIGSKSTIRDYLHDLLKTLWIEGEGFSGKRPFGDSGWEYDIYYPLARDGFIDLGAASDDGCYDVYTESQLIKANRFILNMIEYCFYGAEGRKSKKGKK